MASGDLFGTTELPSHSSATPGTAQLLQAHCDGGARGNPGPSGYGAVIADASGKILAELSEYLGHHTNNFAEYSGLLGVLAWTLDHGYSRLRVVSDSELMVKQIQGRYKVNSPELRPLFEEARRRIARLHSFEIHHALRHKNKDADRLANEAMDRGTGRGIASPSGVVPGRDLDTPPSAGKRPAADSSAGSGAMLRGFVRDGLVHPLGGAALPEGRFVKIIVE